MAEKCFICVSIKTLDDVFSPDRYDNKSSCPTSRGSRTRRPSILRIIHVGGDEEVFSEPKTASELLKQYPAHCLTLPDIFMRPWGVVSPERRLFPGEKFFLVPTSIVQKLQFDLLQKLCGKELSDHKNGGIISQETGTNFSFSASLFKDGEEKLGRSALEFYTRRGDDCMKDFKEESLVENEMTKNSSEAAPDFKYVEMGSGNNNMEKAFGSPIKKRIIAPLRCGWSPALETVQEIRSTDEHIR